MAPMILPFQNKAKSKACELVFNEAKLKMNLMLLHVFHCVCYMLLVLVLLFQMNSPVSCDKYETGTLVVANDPFLDVYACAPYALTFFEDEQKRIKFI